MIHTIQGWINNKQIEGRKTSIFLSWNKYMKQWLEEKIKDECENKELNEKMQ